MPGWTLGCLGRLVMPCGSQVAAQGFERKAKIKRRYLRQVNQQTLRLNTCKHAEIRKMFWSFLNAVKHRIC